VPHQHGGRRDGAAFARRYAAQHGRCPRAHRVNKAGELRVNEPHARASVCLHPCMATARRPHSRAQKSGSASGVKDHRSPSTRAMGNRPAEPLEAPDDPDPGARHCAALAISDITALVQTRGAPRPRHRRTARWPAACALAWRTSATLVSAARGLLAARCLRVRARRYVRSIARRRGVGRGAETRARVGTQGAAAPCHLT
jgi:hypothetical protein